ncbi:MAG: transposase [bacterium]|nr:transposase [bacterium]
MVSRRWISTLVSPEETSTQVRVVFDQALITEGLDALLTDERLDLDLDDPQRPILLAVLDNGPAMTSGDTKAYMAALAITQHHGRPHTPTGQAWIESFFGHIKGEWPHLNTITDPVELETELNRIRIEYNEIRLHEAIGYVTPNDEHHGQGERIRQARRQGLERARQRRLNHKLPNQQQPRGDTMTWFITKPISAEESETPQFATALNCNIGGSTSPDSLTEEAPDQGLCFHLPHYGSHRHGGPSNAVRRTRRPLASYLSSA